MADEKYIDALDASHPLSRGISGIIDVVASQLPTDRRLSGSALVCSSHVTYPDKFRR